MAQIKASVILPTYNEAGNIIKLVEAIDDELSQKHFSHEIIVVDDDSPDKTGLLAEKYFSKIPYVRVIIRKKDRGLAKSIRTGLEAAIGEIVVAMDTDFNHEPKLVPTLVEKCQKYDFVVGSRFIKGGGMENKARERYSCLFNIMIRLILGSPVHDNLSGFFAMRSQELEKLNFDKIFWGYGDYFIRLIYLAKQQGNKFAEIPSFYRNRDYGESKSKFLSMLQDYFLSTLAIRFGKGN